MAGALSGQPCAILSAERDSSKGKHAGVVLAANAIPPTGPATLAPLPDNLLLAPGLLWVLSWTVGNVYHVLPYSTSAEPIGTRTALTATALSAPVTVETMDPSLKTQLWEFVPGKDATSKRSGFSLQNLGVSGAMMGRSVSQAVPGAQLELVPPPVDGVDHMVPYIYEVVPVMKPKKAAAEADG